jgi:hypothetical protein
MSQFVLRDIRFVIPNMLLYEARKGLVTAIFYFMLILQCAFPV